MSLSLLNSVYIPVRFHQNSDESFEDMKIRITNERKQYHRNLSEHIEKNSRNDRLSQRSVGEKMVVNNEHEFDENAEEVDEMMHNLKMNMENNLNESKTIGKNMVDEPMDFSSRTDMSKNDMKTNSEKMKSDIRKTMKVSEFTPVRRNENMFKQFKSNGINKNYIDKLCKGC